MAPIGALLSGGIDSCVMLAALAKQGRTVQPFYVRTGLRWQAEEERAIARFAAALESKNLLPTVILETPCDDLYGLHWSTSGCSVPAADSPDEAVYLPGRNALLLLKPALWCQAHGIHELALGTLASNPFADAMERFFDAFEGMLAAATGACIDILRPLELHSKRDVITIGRDLPLQWTFSCIAPLGGRHCGACNKCAERRTAFAAAGVADPTEYAAAGAATAGMDRAVPRV